MSATEMSGGRQSASAPVVTISLLGRFAVAVDGRTVPDAAWRGQKVRALIKLLALAPAGRLARDQLLDRLWPDFAPEAAASNLYTTLTAARRALAPATVQLRAGIIALPTAPPPRIDVVAFREAAMLARGAADPAPYEAALALYGGDLLPDDRYEDWAAGPREVLRETFIGLLRALAERQLMRGQREAAIGTLGRLLAAEPTDEAAHGELLRLHAAGGNRAAALRQFAAAREHLARELDAEPGPELRRLHAALITGELVAAPAPAVAAPTPVEPAPAAAPDYRLPVPLTAFFGRADDLAGVGALLAEEAVRLVTLTGVGGTGKTRLALALAHERHAAHPGQVCFVELAPIVVAERQTVIATVAAALGLRDQPGEPLETTIAAALRDRPFLLLLDNCEHLIEEIAGLAADLFAVAPRLQILATSREALRLPGEVVWAVPPLPLPAEGEDGDPATVLANPAVALFLDRARRRQPGFALDRDTTPAVVALCRRLDGLPLALELAAARLGVLSVNEIVVRLDDLLETLVTRERGLPARQRTMRAALDWSYGLLVPDEQRFFRRLAPFVGLWPFAAAVAANPAADEATTLALLEGLIEKSLVRVVPDGAASYYRLLEPVRQYAAARLAEAGESSAAYAQHAAYCVELTVGVNDFLTSAERDGWLARLDREGDTIRAALDWLQTQHRAADGLTICAEVWRYWSARGRYDDIRRRFASFLAMLDDPEVPPPAPHIFVHALFGAGMLAREQGDYAAAIALLTRVLDLSREQNLRPFIAGGLTQLAYCFERTGDFLTARSYFREALALRRADNSSWGVAIALAALGTNALALGDRETGLRYLYEALAINRAIGDAAQLASTLSWIGAVHLQAGDLIAARPFLEEGQALGAATGAQVPQIRCLLGLGELALRERDRAASLARLTAALDQIERASVWSEFTACLRGFAALAATIGEAERAVRLAAAAAGSEKAQGIVPNFDATDFVVTLLAGACARLAPATAARAEAAGEHLDRAAAIAEARAIAVG